MAVMSACTPTPTAKYRGGRKPKKLAPAASQELRAWLLAHQDNPYPTDAEKLDLQDQLGITHTQLNNWFVNARRRILGRNAQSSRQRPAPGDRAAFGASEAAAALSALAAPMDGAQAQAQALEDEEDGEQPSLLMGELHHQQRARLGNSSSVRRSGRARRDTQKPDYESLDMHILGEMPASSRWKRRPHGAPRVKSANSSAATTPYASDSEGPSRGPSRGPTPPSSPGVLRAALARIAVSRQLSRPNSPAPPMSQAQQACSAAAAVATSVAMAPIFSSASAPVLTAPQLGGPGPGPMPFPMMSLQQQQQLMQQHSAMAAAFGHPQPSAAQLHPHLQQAAQLHPSPSSQPSQQLPSQQVHQQPQAQAQAQAPVYYMPSMMMVPYPMGAQGRPGQQMGGMPVPMQGGGVMMPGMQLPPGVQLQQQPMHSMQGMHPHGAPMMMQPGQVMPMQGAGPVMAPTMALAMQQQLQQPTARRMGTPP